MGKQDGGILGVEKVVDNGPNSSRFNIVIVSEGYRHDQLLDEMPRFRFDCNTFLRALFWMPPFTGLWDAINIFRLDVRSTESGMDDPMTCGDGTSGSGAQVATYFDSGTCDVGVRRALRIDNQLVESTVRAFVPEYHRILVFVNSSLYGAAAGSVAKFTTTRGWRATAIHELGHTFGLADEYECYVCNRRDDGRNWGGFLWVEPGEPNITSEKELSKLKWRDLVLPSTPCPTPASVGPGIVGLFEGGRYYATGLFRPEVKCTMRIHEDPFCAVCRRHIQQQFTPFLSTSTPVVRPVKIPFLNVTARIKEKVVLAHVNGYNVELAVNTNLPEPVSYRCGIDGSRLRDEPAWPRVFVRLDLSRTYPYAHSAIVEGTVSVNQLDYWIPNDPSFTSAKVRVDFEFPRPSKSGGTIVARYDAKQSIAEGDSVTLGLKPDLGGRSNSTSFWIEKRIFYTQIEVEVILTDKGFFTPEENSIWRLRNVVWTPAPISSVGSRAVFNLNHQGGLWWLANDTPNSAPPEAGLKVRVQGTDTVGQIFDINGLVYPYQYIHTATTSTVQRAKIPRAEWPMHFTRTRDQMTKATTVGKVKISLKGSTLQIGNLKLRVAIKKAL